MGTIMSNTKAIVCNANWKSVVSKAYVFSATKALASYLFTTRITKLMDFCSCDKNVNRTPEVGKVCFTWFYYSKHTMPAGQKLLSESVQFCIWMRRVGIGDVKRFLMSFILNIIRKDPMFL